MSARLAGAFLLAALVATTAAGTEPSGAPGAPEVRRLSGPGSETGWVEVRAEVLASDDEAPSQARTRALARARAAAIEFVAGVRVTSGVVSFEQLQGDRASNLVQVLSSVRSDALMVDEELLESRSVPLDRGGYRLHVVLRGRVVENRAAGDAGFRTEVQLPRERFLDGETLTLRVRSSRAARIYVLGVTEDGAALVFPNRHVRDTTVAAGVWRELPSAEQQANGVELTAQVPPGRDSAREALVVVALRGEETLAGVSPASVDDFGELASDADRSLAELLTPLADLPPDSWTFDQVAYEVLAR